MSLPETHLSILLLTEDSAKDAHATLAALAKKMLQLLVPGCHTNKIDFLPANEDAKRAMHANRWKSENPRDHQKLIDLRRTIARKINEPGDASFVLFHADGDRSFSKRALSENWLKFEDRIRDRVRQLISEELGRRGASEKLEATMARLCLLMPFYSIEAWVYQNCREAIRICRASYNGADIERFEEWENNRASLDEVEAPKDNVCLGSRYNLQLATARFPADDVFNAGASFAEAVAHLLGCADLTRGLERTRV